MFKKSSFKFDFKTEDNSLEKKIFKIILYFALLMSVINAVLNFIVGFTLIINIKWLLMIFLAMFILKSMQKNYFEFFQLKMTFYLILVFIFFPLAWFQSGGSANNGIAYTFLIFISITFLFERKPVRNFFIFSLKEHIAKKKIS